MPDLAFILSFLPPDFSGQLAFLPYAILGILGLAALVDAFTGRVPNSLVLIGVSSVIFLSASYEGWTRAGGRLFVAFLAFTLLKTINRVYISLCRRDAFGMGDAKWTALAAMAFGLPNVFWAWVIGAWLGLVWMLLRRLVGYVFPLFRSYGYIHFAPFLFAGLVLRLYAVKFLSA